MELGKLIIYLVLLKFVDLGVILHGEPFDKWNLRAIPHSEKMCQISNEATIESASWMIGFGRARRIAVPRVSIEKKETWNICIYRYIAIYKQYYIYIYTYIYTLIYQVDLLVFFIIAVVL